MSVTAHVIEWSMALPAGHPRGDLLAATEVNTTGLKKFIQDNIIWVVFLLIVVVLLTGALKANLSKVVTVGGLTLISLAFYALSNNETAASGVGDYLLSLVGIS